MLKTQDKKKQRDAGTEVLRIIAMLMIIISHLAVHGGIKYDALSVNSAFISMMRLGDIGVDIFILITGYYSIHSAPRLKKGIMLIVETVFYSVMMFLLSCAVSAQEFSFRHLGYSLIPFISDMGNWFIVTYIILYTLIPFINGGLRSLGRRAFFGSLLLIFLVGTVIPDAYATIGKFQDYGISRLVWFVFMYALGAYIRIYPPKLCSRCGLCLSLLLITGAMICVFRYFYADIQYNHSGKFDGLSGAVIYFLSDISRPGFLSVLFSVFALILFTQLKFKGNKLLYAVSGSTFGIYLLHDSNWFRRFLWDNIFNVKQYAEAKYFIPIAFGTVAAIFVVCSVIDIIRKNLLERPLFSSKLYERCESFIKRCVDKCLRRLDINN